MDKSIYTRKQERLQHLLRTIRIEKKLRQQDLAKRLKQPQSFVSKYEAGERRLDFLEVREIAVALGMPFCTFVERFEESIE